MSSEGQSAQRRPALMLGAAASAAVAAFAAVYVTLGRPDNAAAPPKTAGAQPPAAPQAVPSGPGSNSLSQGHMAAFVFRKAPEALPEVKFQDGSAFDAAAVVWNVEKVLNKEAAHFAPDQIGVTVSRMPTLKSAKAVDPLTVELTTSEPDAFLPINLPFTMPPSEAAEVARKFKPRILYPYHQGSSDPEEVKELLADLEGTEVRVRELP